MYMTTRYIEYFFYMPEWWNGRHVGLKIRCLHGRVGSSPTSGIKKKTFNIYIESLFYLLKKK